MALDQAVAKRLWLSRFKQELEATARKNHYLDPSGLDDVENLFGELTVNVFLKAVNAFNMEKVTFSEDVDRAFTSFFENIKKQYLTNLSEHHNTGKSNYFRDNQRSLDKPLKGEDEGDEGGSLLDIIPSPDDAEGLQEMADLLHQLPQNLADPINYIMHNTDPGDVSSVMQEVRDRYGWTTTRLFDALSKQPAFIDYVTSI